jgi:hypothetical protein
MSKKLQHEVDSHIIDLAKERTYTARDPRKTGLQNYTGPQTGSWYSGESLDRHPLLGGGVQNSIPEVDPVTHSKKGKK